MKIMKTDLAAYRKERLKSSRFLVVFFLIIAICWPVIHFEFLIKDQPTMSDLTFEDYRVFANVKKDGSSRIKEIVKIKFDSPQVYVRSVGELAATDKHVRYWATAASAKIDGKKVKIRADRVGVGGHNFYIGDKIVGEHEIEFTYDSVNSVFYQKGKPVFRARLLPRFSFSEVENFYAEIKLPGAIEKGSQCWLTNSAKPSSKKDRCEWKEFSSAKAVVAIPDPAYLRPVRVAIFLEDYDYSVTKLPWTGYWDSTLGRQPWAPVLSVLLAVGFVVSFRKWGSSVSDRLLLWGVGVAVPVGAVKIWFFDAPSIAYILIFTLLWIAIPAYLRKTEAGNLLSQEQFDEILAKSKENDLGKNSSRRSKKSASNPDSQIDLY